MSNDSRNDPKKNAEETSEKKPVSSEKSGSQLNVVKKKKNGSLATLWFYKIARAIVPPFIWLLMPYKILGKKNVPKDGPLLLCSNHTAYKDPVFMALVQKRQLYFMAKMELFKKKLAAFFIRNLGAFPIERSGGTDGIKSGIDILNNDGVVGIFIEGTRSKTGELLRPKPGVTMLAYDTKATVVPMAIVGKNGKPPRIFTKTIINVGEPISFEELGMKDSSGLEMRKASRLIMEEIRKLRNEALTMMGVEVTDNAEEDGKKD